MHIQKHLFPNQFFVAVFIRETLVSQSVLHFMFRKCYFVVFFTVYFRRGFSNPFFAIGYREGLVVEGAFCGGVGVGKMCSTGTAAFACGGGPVELSNIRYYESSSIGARAASSELWGKTEAYDAQLLLKPFTRTLVGGKLHSNVRLWMHGETAPPNCLIGFLLARLSMGSICSEALLREFTLKFLPLQMFAR